MRPMMPPADPTGLVPWYTTIPLWFTQFSTVQVALQRPMMLPDAVDPPTKRHPFPITRFRTVKGDRTVPNMPAGPAGVRTMRLDTVNPFPSKTSPESDLVSGRSIGVKELLCSAKSMSLSRTTRLYAVLLARRENVSRSRGVLTTNWVSSFWDCAAVAGRASATTKARRKARKEVSDDDGVQVIFKKSFKN